MAMPEETMWHSGDSGWQTREIEPDVPRVVVHERAVLRKFDGDDQTQPPVEVLLVEDGIITGRWAGQEVADAPDE